MKIDLFHSLVNGLLELPYIGQRIQAGFPSPADDFLDQPIDLNKEFVKNPSTTFYGRVRGDSMKDAGIDDGDLLIIDKSLRPSNDNIAVCFIDGEFTVKRIKMEKGICWLMPANIKYKPLKVTDQNDFVVWGIVVHTIKSF